MKVVWRVDPPPTGRYRSFERRAWPQASYGKDGKPAAFLDSTDEYEPSKVRTGEHAPISITICHHQHPNRGNSWALLKLKATAKTLAEAKSMVAQLIAKHPEYSPLPDPISPVQVTG